MVSARAAILMGIRATSGAKDHLDIVTAMQEMIITVVIRALMMMRLQDICRRRQIISEAVHLQKR